MKIDIEYTKNELKKIEIINSYTKDILKENNISINKNNLEIVKKI